MRETYLELTEKLTTMSIPYVNWIVFILIAEGVICGGVDFIALDKPCLDSFRLCSTKCKVSRMTGDLDCEFCVCDDPDNVILWPQVTTPTTPPPTTPISTTTLSPGQWTANNITYTNLKNPCIQFEASCPVLCKRWNTTYEGRECERCMCTSEIGGKIIGKRIKNIQPFMKFSGQSGGNGKQGCIPLFACPVFQCPAGEKFAESPDGCRMCRCVPDTAKVPSESPGTELSPNTHASPMPPGYGPHFIETFCRKEPDECPSDCNVVDYRVGSWHCYHCSCPNNSYTALQDPCNKDKRLCPDTCRIRTLVDAGLELITCQYCDCSRKRRNIPFSCRACFPCFYGFDAVGRRRRRSSICNHPICASCRKQIIGSPSPTTAVHVQQTTHKYNHIPIKDLSNHCLPSMDTCPSICHHFTVSGCILCLCGEEFLTLEKINSFVHTVHPNIQTSTYPVKPSQTQIPTVTTKQTQKQYPTTTLKAVMTSGYVTSLMSNSCYNCSGESCSEQDLISCPKDVGYCMNTLSRNSAGAVDITRSCVTEDDCYNKWWSLSADNSDCIAMTNALSGPVGQAIVCNFCCKGDRCNRLGRIPDVNLYTGDEHPTSATIIEIG